MRVILLTILLITACFVEDEASITQSGGASAVDLTNINSSAYIKENECLVDIEGTLSLDSNKNLSALSQCLPSAKLSWRFKADDVTETTKRNLSLAILFDTSYSLKSTDSSGKRYDALKNYLRELYRIVNSARVSATINIYPFKYCDEGESNLLISSRRSADMFEKSVTHLIKFLSAKGVNGSTNYLQSFDRAADFLEGQPSDNAKQLLIITDGFPSTFNDGSEKTITCDRITNFNEEDSFEEHINKHSRCVTGTHHPSRDSCKAPKTANNNYGMTPNNKYLAFEDPINQVLAMIQHRNVINTRKNNKFEVYTVLLNVDNSTGGAGIYSITHLADDFIKSFSNAYEIVGNASGLTRGLSKVLQSQTSFAYKSKGTAYIGASKGGNNTVDDHTKLHGTNVIKVGRDSSRDTVHDYSNDSQDTLTVAHGLRGRGGDFGISYSFNFSGGKGNNCRSDDYRDVGSLEANKYQGNGYNVWCLLARRCDDATQCCDEGRAIGDAEGSDKCAGKQGSWQWSGFEGSTKVCACVCDPAAKAACQGKGQTWNESTCTCTRTNVVSPPNDEGGKIDGTDGKCTADENTCCNNGIAGNQPACGKGQILNIQRCACVQEITYNPSPSTPPDKDNGEKLSPDKNAGKIEGNGEEEEEGGNEERPPLTNQGIVYGEKQYFQGL